MMNETGELLKQNTKQNTRGNQYRSLAAGVALTLMPVFAQADNAKNPNMSEQFPTELSVWEESTDLIRVPKTIEEALNDITVFDSTTMQYVVVENVDLRPLMAFFKKDKSEGLLRSPQMNALLNYVSDHISDLWHSGDKNKRAFVVSLVKKNYWDLLQYINEQGRNFDEEKYHLFFLQNAANKFIDQEAIYVIYKGLKNKHPLESDYQKNPQLFLSVINSGKMREKYDSYCQSYPEDWWYHRMNNTADIDGLIKKAEWLRNGNISEGL